MIGNPPYSGISQNNSDWITALIEDYKYVDGEHFGERKHWLHDDYVKFIRMSENTIAKNPSGGVLGFITNHGYLDNPTFRGMRWHLLKTFDKIWVLDLHGNAKKKEACPDGSPDVNLFDIQQGVSLIIAVRKGSGSDKLAEVSHGDLWGTRDVKTESLRNASTGYESFPNHINPQKPYNFFVPFDDGLQKQYDEGLSVRSLFGVGSVGFVTAKDRINISFSEIEARDKLKFIVENSDQEIRRRFDLKSKDSTSWKLEWAKNDAIENKNLLPITITYRPFDYRHSVYTGKSGGLYARPIREVMRHIIAGENLGLLISRSAIGEKAWKEIQCTSQICEFGVMSTRPGNGTPLMPLYLYPNEDAAQGDAFAAQTRTLNLDPKLYAKICKAAGIDPKDTDMAREASPSPLGEGLGEGPKKDGPPTQPSPLKGGGPDTYEDFRAATGDARPSEVKVFDYIYGVLHSPDYRKTFAEFLKIDFPRIPYPASPEVFADISHHGEALRRLHLMEAGAIGDTPYPFLGEAMEDETPQEVAAKHPRFVAGNDGLGRVYINGAYIKDRGDTGQYFDNVPKLAWEFYIGGYQPAQKWLKDRKGRALDYNDIGHYQKIIKILGQTHRIMGEIQLPLEGEIVQNNTPETAG